MDELELDRPVVVSPSMSGGFSLPLVAGHSDRLSGFVAVAPVAIERHLTELKGNPLPALLLWGDDDSIVPLDDGRRLAEALDDARIEVLEGAGHACYMKRPERFHELLLGFVAEVHGS